MSRLFAPACARNKGPIANVLLQQLSLWQQRNTKNNNTGATARANVLEIACGTGEHAAFFAKMLTTDDDNMLVNAWYPTDKTVSDEQRESIVAWKEHEQLTDDVMRPARELNCLDESWEKQFLFDNIDEQITHIFLANMIHISEWEATVGLLRGCANILSHNIASHNTNTTTTTTTTTTVNSAGSVIIYGPFTINCQHTAPSNAEFDISLQSRNDSWKIRDMDNDVDRESRRHGLMVSEKISMPANNFILVLDPIIKEEE